MSLVNDQVKAALERAHPSAALVRAQRGIKKIAPPTDTLPPGGQLVLGQALVSKNGRFRFAVQADGNMVLYRRANNAAYWDSGTRGKYPSLIMQTDGNAVMKLSNQGVVWHTSSQGNPGAFLVMQDDGNLVVYSAARRPLWSSETPGGQKHDGSGVFGQVFHAVSSAANGVASVTGNMSTLLKSTVGQITNNPIWDVAAAGVGLVPGLGTVSAGMTIASALGRGISLQDAALAGARALLPGGAAAAAIFDIGVGVAKSKNLDGAALDFVRNQLPKSHVPLFDAGVMASRAKDVTQANWKAFAQRIADHPEAQLIHDLTLQAVNVRKRAYAARDAAQGAIQRGSNMARNVTRSALQTVLHHARVIQDQAARGHAGARSGIKRLEARAKSGDRSAANALKILLLAKEHNDATVGAWYQHPVADSANPLAHDYYTGFQALVDSAAYTGPRVGNKFFSRAFA